MRFHVAVETTLDFCRRLLRRESKLHLHADLRESLHELGVIHLRARREIEIVAVRPRMHSHLRAREMHSLRRTVGYGQSLTMMVNRDCRLMSVLHRPDDVLRSPRRIAAEENAGQGRLHRRLVDDGHVPLTESDPDVSLDPGK